MFLLHKNTINYLIGNAAHEDIWLSHVISYNLIIYFNFKTQDWEAVARRVDGSDQRVLPRTSHTGKWRLSGPQ